MPDRKRIERMVDFGLEEAEITFDLGPPPTEEEMDQAFWVIEELAGD